MTNQYNSVKERHRMNRIKSSEEFMRKIYLEYSKDFIIGHDEILTKSLLISMKCKKHNTEEYHTVRTLLSSNRKNYPCKICESEKIISDIASKHKANGWLKKQFDSTQIVTKSSKITLICPMHGPYSKTKDKHEIQDCKKCTVENERLKRQEDAIKRFEKLHERFDFSLIDNYSSYKSKVTIRCKKHDHIIENVSASSIENDSFRKEPCKYCEEENVKKSLENHFEDSLTNLEKFKFVNKSKPITVNCRVHGPYEKRFNKHFEQSCPKCNEINYRSKKEQELLEFVESIYGDSIITNDRNLINSELDIYIPKENLAIEFNGLYWHSTAINKDKNYHINKTIRCLDKNVNLIHVFEDDWDCKREIVKSRISNILQKNSTKIYGRKCEIREINSRDCRDFLTKNHLQGNVNSKYKIGLFYQDKLVSLMTFGNLRIVNGSKHKDNHFELLRFCNKINTSVIGAASKLLKYFIRTYNPTEIYSYSDKCWSSGNLYKSIGFEYCGSSGPSYSYVVNSQRIHRFNYRKSVLVSEGFPKNLSERQIMESRSIHRIYDCGTDKWKLIIKNSIS